MPSGNGARAAQKRERNAKQAAATGGSAKSQLEGNAKALSITCQVRSNHNNTRLRFISHDD